MTANENTKAIVQYVESKIDRIKAVAAQHVRAESLVRVAGAAMSREPLLSRCTPQSVVISLMNAAQLGLEPNLLGACYLVPYKNNKIGAWEAQLIVGYRGLIELARRSGVITNISAHPVFEKDEFDISMGLDPKLVHRPFLGGDRGKMIAVYGIAQLVGGSYQVEFMTRADVDRIRARSKAATSGPWVTDYDEMARKTVVRRMCKYLPLTIEMVRALEQDIAAEEGYGYLDPDLVANDPDLVEYAAQAQGKTQAEELEEAVGPSGAWFTDEEDQPEAKGVGVGPFKEKRLSTRSGQGSMSKGENATLFKTDQKKDPA